MPKPRYYNVLRGMRGAAARQAYLDYLTGLAERPSDIGNRGPRDPSTALFLTPFAFPLPENHQLVESALKPAWDNMKTQFANFTTDTIGSDTKVNIKSYHAPRLIKIVKDPTGTVARSGITNLQYLKYDNTSSSVPFGKNLAADTVASVYSTISTAVIGTVNNIATRLVAERT